MKGDNLIKLSKLNLYSSMKDEVKEERYWLVM